MRKSKSISAGFGILGLVSLIWGFGRSIMLLPNDLDHAMFVLCCFGFAGIIEVLERIDATLRPPIETAPQLQPTPDKVEAFVAPPSRSMWVD